MRIEFSVEMPEDERDRKYDRKAEECSIFNERKKFVHNHEGTHKNRNFPKAEPKNL